MPSRTAKLLLPAAILALALLPAAQAKGIQEDPDRYPPGVTAVTRTPVEPGKEFHVMVAHDGTYTSAAMAICRFRDLDDTDPNVCWRQFRVPAAEGQHAFATWTASQDHPVWEEGWVIGYKLTLQGSDEVGVPATGGEYYKVVVQSYHGGEAPTGGASRAAPFCTLCLAAIGGAAAVRRRWA